MPAQSGDDLSDIELVDQLLRGVSGAFELFFRRYQRLINHCVRARADAGDVDDLVQGFFERLMARDYRDLKLWQRGTSLPVYLSVVIRNFVTDFNRAKYARQKKFAVQFDTLSEHALKNVSEEGANITIAEEITSAIELRELRKLGIQAWAKLEKRDRFIVCGRLHRELNNETMAERLELTGGALRTALSRAHVRLLLGLKTLAPEYFPTQV